MYSGSDSTESQNYTQWAMNPSSAFQNVPGEQVDWAALAQQWIIMKEAGPPPLQHQQPSAQLKKVNYVRQEGVCVDIIDKLSLKQKIVKL